MKIAVVGGGSAGWLSATMLDVLLNGRTSATKRVEIVLIESPKVPRIGVGEATVPTLVSTLRELGVPEQDFLREADATFKQGIKFLGWRMQPGHSYYHAFDRYQSQGLDLHGLRWAASRRNIPFAYYVSAQPALCDLQKAPRRVTDPDYHGAFNYAYHMDAEKFAGYLSELGKSRGITHILDEVVDVRAGSPGRIDVVVLGNGSQVAADYFLDCTGFARVLISKLPGFEFIPLSDWLICDRAVALQVPHGEGGAKAISPFTQATAMSAGWVWDIGLRNRRGTGYVYSSRHISDDDAERELRSKEGPACDELTARRLKFEVGRLAEPWVGNCVAIGLSGGFIEPMESTGIYLIEYAARTFCELLPLFGEGALLRERFNQLLADRYDEVLNFINIHYVLSDRRDTSFWRDATDPARITSSNRDKLELWKQKMVSASDFANTHQLFGYQNYEYCVYGLGWTAPGLPVGTRDLAPLPSVSRAVDLLTDQLPNHVDYLNAVS